MENAAPLSRDPEFFPKKIQEKAGRLLYRGTAGYRRFQGLVAREIPAEQARTVRTIVRQAILVVAAGLALTVAFRILAWQVLCLLVPHPIPLFMAFNDLEAALILLGSLAFAWRFPRVYGSAFLFPWNVLGFFFGMSPGEDLIGEIVCGVIVWLVIVAFGLLGVLFDSAIERVRKGGNGWASVRLMMILALYVLLIVADKRWPYHGSSHPVDAGFFPWASLPIAVACGAFLIWAGRTPSLAREENKTQSLCRWALQRWQIHVAGIGLAVALCFFPFVGFLGLMGLHNRVTTHSPKEMLYDPRADELPFFWYEKGDFLSPHDFDGGELFSIRDDFWDKGTQNPTRDLIAKLNKDPHNEELSQQVRSSLENFGCQMTPESIQTIGAPLEGYQVYRLVGGSDFYNTNTDPALDSNPSDLFPGARVPPIPLSSPSSKPRAPSFHLDYVPFSAEGEDFSALREKLDDSYQYQLLLIFLGIFGGLILWRRGGDSWPARMTGIWLISMFAGLPCNFGLFFVSALSYRCWQLGLKPEGYLVASALRLAIAVMDATGIVVYLFSVLGLPIAWLWTYFCWPSSHPPGWRQRAQFFRRFILVWLVCLIPIGLTPVAAALYPDNLSLIWTLRCISQPILIFGMIGLGIYWRRRSVGVVLPPLGPWVVVAFMFLEMVTLTSWCFTTGLEYTPRFVYPIPFFALLGSFSALALIVWLVLRWRSQHTLKPATHGERWTIGLLSLTAITASIAVLWIPSLAGIQVAINIPELMAALAVCATFLMLLRADFLNLQAVDDLSYLLVIFAVPAMMQFFEVGLNRLLSRVPLLSEDAILVISVLLAVSLYPRIHHVLSHLCQRFSVPRLHEIEAAIEDGIENLMDLTGKTEKQSRLHDLFVRTNIPSYALYVRRSKGSFGRFISHWPQPPENLSLSESLDKHLGSRKAFIDFYSVPNLWSSFFFQFELRRIENSFAEPSKGEDPPLSCRYLLPICIGNTVCALLFLPAGIAETNQQPFAGILNSLGVAALTQQDLSVRT